ncbi:MAG: HPr family phosphocarrier protein [Lachnospiraceae bacterium]|nr:HPr family phosphocarrier protein [Lachnospiraceae bacterium]
MREFNYTIKSQVGIHLRPAAELTAVAERFDSRVRITKEDVTMNGKSVMSVISLCVKQGDEVTITVEGKDEDLACNALQDFFESRL